MGKENNLGSGTDPLQISIDRRRDFKRGKVSSVMGDDKISE